jgi:aryl-alcohol dehydrogenase-like predicted oxidoreductase
MKIDAGATARDREYVRRAAEDSLRRLGTDRIDLYQLHRPDPTVPIATRSARSRISFARAGARNRLLELLPAAQLRDARAACEPGARAVRQRAERAQPAATRGRARGPAECGHLRLKFLPYFPLGKRALTGKYRRGEPAPQSRASARAGPRGCSSPMTACDRRRAHRVRAVARRSILELAVSWLATRPIVASVIAGATSAEQVRANAAAAGWQLSDADRAKTTGHRA